MDSGAAVTTSPSTATTGRLFHGWRVVGAGAIVQALQAVFFIQGYGQYAVVLERQFGWSKTFISAGYAMNRAESGLLGPLQGWLLGRYGTVAVMRAGVVMMSSGLLALSQIQNKVQFLAALLLTAVGASLSGFLSVTTATVKWFERKRARALSLSGMGFAIGGGFVPLLVFSLERAGWRWTAAGSGLIFFVLGMALMSTFDGTPASRGEFVDGVQPSEATQRSFRAEGVSDVHFTASQALRTRAFWMISLGHASALLVVGAVIAHLSLYLTSEQGYSLQRASFVAGSLPLVQIVGNLLGGVLGDRMNKRILASIAMLGHMVGLLLLAFATHRWMIWLFVPIHGLAWGVRGPLMQALRADYFGSTSFGQIMGFSSLIVMFGTVGGPLVAGILADSTGSYRTGFTILALMAGAGLTFFVLATPPAPPSRS
ncbi:MAG: MFS transporter [Acidimicrobiales bacterium]